MRGCSWSTIKPACPSEASSANLCLLQADEAAAMSLQMALHHVISLLFLLIIMIMPRIFWWLLRRDISFLPGRGHVPVGPLDGSFFPRRIISAASLLRDGLHLWGPEDRLPAFFTARLPLGVNSA